MPTLPVPLGPRTEGVLGPGVGTVGEVAFGRRSPKSGSMGFGIYLCGGLFRCEVYNLKIPQVQLELSVTLHIDHLQILEWLKNKLFWRWLCRFLPWEARFRLTSFQVIHAKLIPLFDRYQLNTTKFLISKFP